MKRIISILLFLFFISIVQTMGQTRVSGVVIDEKDEPVFGANVIVKGTTIGTRTDADGRFSIEVPENARIFVISFIGMITREVAIQPTLRIVLESDVKVLQELVVTAMGITKEKKSLGYAVQTVKSKDLIKAPTTNLASALQGKVSGVEIRPSSGMPGASSLITIRGARSFTGNNSPLYVIDGMPVESTSDMSTGNSVTGTDFSNRAIDIDPNDIESIEVLKGQAASALYGIRASNGVVVITTKSGKGMEKGRLRISVSSNAVFDKVSRYPDYQKEFAQGYYGIFAPTTSLSWGPRISELPNDAGYGGNKPNDYNGGDVEKYKGKYYVPQLEKAGLDPWVAPASYDNMKEFLKTGVSINNSIGLSQSLEKSTYAVFFGNTSQKGIVPSTGMEKYNAKLTAETRLSTYFKTGFVANIVNSKISKMTGANDGVMATVYAAPVSYNMAGIPSYYKDDPFTQNNYRAQGFNNPYWLTEFSSFTENTDRFFGNSFVEYNDNFNTEEHKLAVRYQLGTDAYTTRYQDLWAYGSSTYPEGSMSEYAWIKRTMNSLLTINYNWKINEHMDLTALVGNEFVDNKMKYIYASGEQFVIRGWDHIDNAIIKEVSERYYRERTVGSFANLSFAYKSMLYLGATGRTDIVSTMPRGNRTFFYPSVSLGFVFTELGFMKQNNILNFGKLRLSYAQVGQAGSYTRNHYRTPGYGGGFYSGSPVIYPIDNQVAFTPYSIIYDSDLKPQNTHSNEMGVDLNFLKNKIIFNYTYSMQDVKNQIFDVPLGGSTGASALRTNGGRINTYTHEISLTFNPIQTKMIDFSAGFNFSKIDNYVKDFAPGVESIFLGGFVTPQVRAGKEDKFPVIYGSSFTKDKNGNIVVDKDGLPMIGEAKVIGTVSPDFILGFNTSFRYGPATISALFDWKNGGSIYGGTAGILDFYGVSKASGVARNEGIMLKGVTEDGTPYSRKIEGDSDLLDYYERILDINESSVFGNSFIKLRELALNVDLIKKRALNVTASLYARNILLWTEYPHLDPESSQGNTNMGGAFERFTLPQTTSYGLGLNISF